MKKKYYGKRKKNKKAKNGEKKLKFEMCFSYEKSKVETKNLKF